MTDATLEFPSLSAVCLPKNSTLLRDYPLPAHRRSEVYEQKFDRHTLIYDAIRLDAKTVRLICPRLLNLKAPLLAGLRVDGKAINPKRHRKSLRYEVIDLAYSANAKLEIDMVGQIFPVPIHDKSSLFERQNVAFTMVKDTPFDWIVEWARYHVSAHGLEGVLIFDNGTTTGNMAELGSRLQSETGLRSIAIVSAPFPYGWNAGGKLVVPAKFLQVSLMQIAKLRFLSNARAVLSLDIDELAQPLADKTVFDLTQNARFGLVRLAGQWVYPSQPGHAASQKAHEMSVPTGKPCQPKWCLKPSGLANLFEWSVHRPGGPFFPFAAQSGAFWHCRAATTGWKAKRNTIPEGAEPDEMLKDALNTHLG